MEIEVIKISNEDGTPLGFECPENPLKEKWDKLYPPIPKPEFSQVCDVYGCIWCDRCPRGDNWKVPEEDREVWEQYQEQLYEYHKIHNPSLFKAIDISKKAIKGECMNTKIYSIFPACGKTWLYNHQKDYNLKILDSDSSQFSWLYRKRTEEELEAIRKEWDSVSHKLPGFMYVDKIRDEEIKVRHPDFPNNYIKHIKENIGKYDYIFVSTHDLVREALDKEGLEYTIVYPDSRCKAEWVGRCFIREKKGESGCGSTVMYNNWELWIADCLKTGLEHNEIVLQPGEYLNNYFDIKK